MIKKTLIAVGLILLAFIFLSFISLVFRPKNQLKVDNNHGEDIGELLSVEKKNILMSQFYSNLEDTGSVAYHVEVVTEWGDVLSFKFWEKGDLLRIETVARGAVPEVYIVNNLSEEYYLYYPSENRAVTLMEVAVENVLSYSLYYHTSLVREEDVVIARKEKVNGDVHFVLVAGEKELRVEEETANIVQIDESTEWGEKVVKISDISFEDYPDHLFSLPEGTEKGTNFIY